MKHIVKHTEPIELSAWRRDNCDAKWEDLERSVQALVKRSLIDEQGHICCYCARRIVDHDSHIEHFVPRNEKTGNPALTFVYENMLASCLKNTMRGDPLHCGKARDEQPDMNIMVSPLEPSCEARFRYDGDGEIYAADKKDDAADKKDVAAEAMIQRLQLRCAKLRNLREGAIDGLFALLEGEPEPDGWRRMVDELRTRDAEGRFAPFCIVQIAVIESWLG